MTFEHLQQQDFTPAAELTIDDLETLKVMADPLRLRIREILAKPGTVKQVAAELDIPATKLYYHVNLLEKHGLLTVVDSRIVSGIVEKQYQVSAYRLRLASQLLSGEGSGMNNLELSIRTVFDNTRQDLLDSIQAGVVDTSEDSEVHRGAKISAVRLRLNEEEARQLFARLDEVLTEFVKLSDHNRANNNADTRMYRLFNSTFPTSRADTLPKSEY